VAQTIGNTLQELIDSEAESSQGSIPLQSFGLPCYHEIWEMKAINRTIQLEDIHPHWYFTREDEAMSLELSRPLPVLNPLVIQGRGRPRGALGGVVRATNTRRELSLRSLLVQHLLLLITLRNVSISSIQG
jgi:hypothetical protein